MQNTDTIRHVFLTGKKRVGKSTLLSKILARYDGSVGGFRTLRTRVAPEESYSVHLLAVGTDDLPAESNRLFFCGAADPQLPERFDALGSQVLAGCAGCSLIVMDELGPHEANAARFRDAVLKRLDGDIPVLGVLQAPAEAFWPEVVNHPGVCVLEITKENRDQDALTEQIIHLFQEENT